MLQSLIHILTHRTNCYSASIGDNAPAANRRVHLATTLHRTSTKTNNLFAQANKLLEYPTCITIISFHTLPAAERSAIEAQFCAPGFISPARTNLCVRQTTSTRPIVVHELLVQVCGLIWRLNCCSGGRRCGFLHLRFDNLP